MSHAIIYLIRVVRNAIHMLARSARASARSAAAHARRCGSLSMGGSSALPFPRAAIACILATAPPDSRYLLVKRGNPPNAGSWSIAGGKLELGETLLDGALREVEEEVGLPAAALRLHPRAVSASESIVRGGGDGGEAYRYHYVISQCFAWVHRDYVERVAPGDDAAGARWFSLDEVRSLPGPMGADIAELVELTRRMHAAALLTPPPE